MSGGDLYKLIAKIQKSKNNLLNDFPDRQHRPKLP